MKKSVKLVIAAIASLSLCWFVGQQIKMVNLQPEEEAQMSPELPAETENTDVLAQYSLFDDIDFEGAREIADNPWGSTAGLYEMEDMGQCIFLTPNTSVLLNGLTEDSQLILQYKIHPWVSENSDGAGIIVHVLSDDEIVLYENQFLISNTAEWQLLELDLKEYTDAEMVRISVNNGNNGDDSGDWVIIREENSQNE